MKNHTEDAYSQIKDAIPSCEQILARHKKRSQRNRDQDDCQCGTLPEEPSPVQRQENKEVPINSTAANDMGGGNSDHIHYLQVQVTT